MAVSTDNLHTKSLKKQNSEFEYLIKLLKSVLESSATEEKPDDVSFEKLFALANSHSVANTAFYAVEKLENKPQPQLYAKWQEVRDKALFKDITQQMEFESISAQLEANKIRYLPLKGTVLKGIYSQSDMRLMSDIDLLIDGKNAQKAQDIMHTLGYYTEHFGAGCHDVYMKKPVMNVEIHRQLFGAEHFDLEAVFTEPWKMCTDPKGCRWDFDKSHFFVYIVSHAAKHYYGSGTGIRTFMDIYLYKERYGGELDMSLFDQMLSKKTAQMCKDLVGLAEVLFGGAERTDKYSQMIKYMLGCGTYGTTANSVDNEIKRRGKAGYLFSQLFPSRSLMCYSYPILAKAPILLPFCWIIRLVTKPFISRKKTMIKLKKLFSRQ
ncbi:nucleotidyltransferase family protein [Ruminococcus sp.]|uniref:nucleotidyltransferase domain-containing protein n=1 Tax=Ruminococcus sp. TaxID=41978 RepID=UPI0025E75619|nr:nucleotidyltransferase family protein [Ruminococcus sp.]